MGQRRRPCVYAYEIRTGLGPETPCVRTENREEKTVECTKLNHTDLIAEAGPPRVGQCQIQSDDISIVLTRVPLRVGGTRYTLTIRMQRARDEPCLRPARAATTLAIACPDSSKIGIMN